MMTISIDLKSSSQSKPARMAQPNALTAQTPPRCSQEYMESLPIWKAELLSGTFSTDQLDTLREHLLQAHPLLMCSDGGAKGNTGSFGWVIATSRQALWEIIGTATGWYANSFRSEGIGQLALLVSLETHMTYYQLHNIPPPWSFPSEPWIRIATDNQGLITRIK
jgi:hypothetical protein